MSIEAVYSIEFATMRSAEWEGGGVFILDTDRIFGGDSSLAYIGHYTLLDGSKFSAKVRIVRHNSSLRSIFGTSEQEFSVDIEGQTAKPYRDIQLVGRRPDMPNIPLRARARRIAELP